MGGSTRVNTASVSANTSIGIGDQLDLGIGTALGAATITLAGVTGNGRDLALNASGVTTLNGVVSAVGNLSTDAAGSTVIAQTVNAGSVTLNDVAQLGGATITTGGGQIYNNAVSSGSTVALVAGGDITFNSSLNTIDLLFNANGNVRAANSGNVIQNALINCEFWSALGPEGFVVSDSASAKVFAGTAAGTCVDIDNNEAAKRLASQLVPQIQFKEIQADAVEIRGIPLQKAGILTRSSELFVKPSEALTRSGEVNPGGPGN
jgi:hypothetical protein